MAVPDIQNLQSLILPTKPNCLIKYSISSLDTSNVSDAAILIIFINGLGLPQAFWQESLTLICADNRSSELSAGRTVFLTTYDRYGQGLSSPSDGNPANPHDIVDSVKDLDDLINTLKSTHLKHYGDTRIFLVAHSIGVNLSRLYCQHHPGTVSAMLFLDSNIANTDFISLLPDPDEPNFNEHVLPSDTTVEQLRWTRNNYEKMFHPNAPNPENLIRTNIPSLLPVPDNPKLVGDMNGGMLITVVGHDPDSFATESLKISTYGLTQQFIEPAWQAYNKSLLKLVKDHEVAEREVVIAEGSGHFIQRDNPKCVADEVLSLLVRLAAQE